jgi:hypothetical protein
MAKNPIIRKFMMSDGSMIQWARKIKALLLLFLADFTAYDAMFTNPFVTAYGTQIDDAEALPDDEVVLGQQKALSDVVEQNMQLCRDKFQQIKRFAMKAFPNQPAVWDEFGFSRYDFSRQVQTRMILFMRDLHVTAQRYNAQLIAVNFTQPMIDEIQTLHDSINTSDSSQEVKKETRTLDSQTRVTAYNDVYDKGSDICEAGKYIYRNDPAKYNMFIINPSGIQSVFTGSISAGETQNILEKTFDANAQIILTNTGTADLQFALKLNAGDVVLVGEGVTVLAGTSQTVQASALGDETQNHFLNVTNNTAQEGSWSVEI